MAIDKLKPFLVNVVISAVSAIMVVMYFEWWRPAPPQIATVDLQGLTLGFIGEQVKTNKSKTELKASAKHYSDKVHATASELAEAKNIIILPKDLVVAGTVDITPFFELALKEASDVQN
ncbi:MAG: type-F conjugative transfer system protein TrbI [Gammaproteobacteria bacterium]|nr:type-F conjugative transfer system protein TrbI [Gammaproteobacteria bacterium]